MSISSHSLLLLLLSISVFTFLVFLFYTFSCRFPCGRLSWLTSAFERMHVKIASRIVSYRTCSANTLRSRHAARTCTMSRTATNSCVALLVTTEMSPGFDNIIKLIRTTERHSRGVTTSCGQSQNMPQGKLAGCTVRQTDVTLNYTTHYLSWGMLSSSAANWLTTTDRHHCTEDNTLKTTQPHHRS